MLPLIEIREIGEVSLGTGAAFGFASYLIRRSDRFWSKAMRITVHRSRDPRLYRLSENVTAAIAVIGLGIALWMYWVLRHVQ